MSPAEYLESVTSRHWEAFFREMEAEPGTAERRRLKLRTLRLSRLRRAAAARVEAAE